MKAYKYICSCGHVEYNTIPGDYICGRCRRRRALVDALTGREAFDKITEKR